MNLYFANQQPLNVEKCLGQGGEGRVFALVELEPQHAVKVYHQLPTAEKQAKLQAMVDDDIDVLGKIALWPTDLVYNEQQQVIGFVMPLLPIDSLAIHHLYNPSQRKLDFPQADYAFLVHAARNLAAAFAYLHSCGHCVGDVNQGNVVVAPDATITLIDCDSFQIQHQNRLFACEVGVAHFTPPELHGQPFAQVTKTTTHDSFGLAILIFHLLMMGRHPFAGVYLGNGEMSIEKAITQFRYAYSEHSQQKQMSAPPKSPHIDWLPESIKQLFEDAFDIGVDKRPTAQQWLTALDSFEKKLVACEQEKAHKYYKSLSVCPWCQFANQHKVDFFSKENHRDNVSIIDGLLNTQPYEIQKQLDLINIPHFSATLPKYAMKDYRNLAKFTGDISWSFSILFAFVCVVGVSEFALSDFVFSSLLVFLGSFVFSAAFWLLIFVIFICLKFSNKKLEWLLDFWLASSGYLNKKKNYFLGGKRLLEFGEVWQSHVLEGEKIIAFKAESLALCDDYNNENVTNQIIQFRELADKLPTLPLELRQKISEYQDVRQQLLGQWQKINHNFIKVALSCQLRGNTFFPEEEFFNDSKAKANRHIISILLSVIISALLIIGLWHEVAKELAPKPVVKIEEPIRIEKPILQFSTNGWYALDENAQKKVLGEAYTVIVVDTEKKLMWTNFLPESAYGFYPNYIEPNPNSVAIQFLLEHLNVDKKYMGYDDWRLPTSAELQRLALTQGVDDVFSFPPRGIYASGNKDVLDGLFVDFPSGKVDYDIKRPKQLRLVRNVGTEKIPSYKPESYNYQRWQLLDQKGDIIPSEDYVGQREWCAQLDTKTNLVWTEPHRVDGFSPSLSEVFTVYTQKETENTLNHLKGLNACGLKNWHVPSTNQISSYLSYIKNHFSELKVIWLADDTINQANTQLTLEKMILSRDDFKQPAKLVLMTKYKPTQKP